MAKDKRDEKQSILGELESIKDLLNEDEFADIPTLSNDLSVDDLNVDDLSANDLADIPVLTQSPDDIPVLKPAHEVTEAELPQLDIPELDTTEYDIPTLEAEPPTLELNPGQLTEPEPTLNYNQELNLEPCVDATEENLELDYEFEAQPLQLTDSLLEQEIDSVDISTEVAEDLNLSPAIDDFSIEDTDLESDSVEEDSNPQESPDLIDEPVLLDESDFEETDLNDSLNTIETSTDSVELPELSKVPYALPGQQSLFESGASAKEKSQEAESSQAEINQVEASPKKHVSKGSTTKARGENPFLPQHIRDRLHTNKTLVDIIKEYPPAPEKKTHPTNHVVEEIIADYMPKIEAELRERLLKLADEGLLVVDTHREDQADMPDPE